MNKVYRVVWNASLAIWVAVSELARSQTKRSQGGLVHAEQGAISAQSNSSTARFNYKLNPLTQMIGLSLGLSTLLATTSVMAVTGAAFEGGVDLSCFYDVTTESVICGDATTTVNESARNTVVMGTGATANNTADIVIGLNAAKGFIPRGELDPANQALESNQFFVNGVKTKFVDTAVLADANVKPATLNNVVIGEAAGTNATGARNIVIGKNAATSHYGDDSITLGTNANNFKLNGAQDGTKADTVTRARQTVAVGVNSMTYNDDAIAVGNSAKAYHGKAIAIGPNARAGNSIGVRKNIVQSGAIAMGSDAVAPLAGDIAIGVSSGSNVSQNIPTTIDAGGNVTIGNRAGSGSYSYSSVALGNNSGQSMGSVNVPQGDNTVVGSSSGNNVKGNTNTAIGWQVGSNIGSNTNTAVGARTGQNIAGANNVAFSIYSGNMVLGSSNISMGDRTGQFVGVHKDAVKYDTATKKFVDANGVAVATATGTNNIAMGSQAGSYVAGQGNFALGENTGNYVNYHPVTSVMGGGQGGNLAFGKNAGNYINGSNNIAFGQGAGAGSLQEILQRNNTINLGYGAIAYKSDALAFGNSAKAHTANSLSFGKDSEAGTAGSTTAINALAIGTGAKALAKNAISIGTGNVVSGENSGAIGDPSIINGANSYSVGNNNAIGASSQNVFVLGNEVQIGEDETTNVSGAVALGHASDVIVKNGVALGSSSVADRDALVTPSVATTATVADNQIFGLDSSTIKDKTAIQNTVVGNLGAVSVGSDTATRQITHVAAGSEDSDAVNVAQLKAVANTPLGFTDDKATQLTRKLGENLHVKGGAKGSLTDGNIGVVANGTDTLEVKLAKDIDLGATGSVTTGNTVVNTSGVTINDGSTTVSLTSNGLDNGGNVISNVKAGDLSATSTDAVNGSQLYATNQNVAKNATNIANNSTNITNLQNQTFKLQANGDVASAVKSSDTVQFLNGENINITRNGNDITVATAKAVAFDKVTVGNVVVDKTTNKITGIEAGTADTDAVNVSQLKAVQNAVTETDNFAVKYDQNADGSVNKDSVTLAGTAATATQDANTGVITTTAGTSLNNVASAGDYQDVANANKAVNAGDLNNAILDASHHVKDILGGSTVVAADGSLSNQNIGGTGQSTIHDAIAAVNTAATQAKNTVSAGENIRVTTSQNADGSHNYQVATQQDVNFDSVQVGDVNISAAGIQAGNQKVSNVADGSINANSKDAVNGSQLHATNQKVVEYLGGGAGYDNITQSFNNPTYSVGYGSSTQQYNNVGSAIDALNKADQALDHRITNLGDQLQQAFYSTNERIDDVEKRANAGIAAAMALENAPYIPGKYTYAAGAAYHGGENAIGLTLRKTADNGRWSLTGGVAAGSQGDPSVRVGISGVID